jgi:hypothetical protein
MSEIARTLHAAFAARSGVTGWITVPTLAFARSRRHHDVGISLFNPFIIRVPQRSIYKISHCLVLDMI